MDPDSGFWSESLQESVQSAAQQGKTLFCFVTDRSEDSEAWEQTITGFQFEKTIRETTVRLRLFQGSQDFEFLKAVCPVENTPALVLIKIGHIEENLQAGNVTMADLREKLLRRFTVRRREPMETTESSSHLKPNSGECLEFPPSTGRMRLPSNAYDALKERTEKLQQQNISSKNILLLQLRLIENIPTLKPYVDDIKSRAAGTPPTLSEELTSRLLNTPASMLQPRQTSSASSSPAVSTSRSPTNDLTPRSSAAPSPAPEATSTTTSTPSESITPAPTQPRTSSQQSQRVEYIRQQREREASQRAERERIKAQIKADREERRRLDSIRKQSELAETRKENSTTSSPSSTDIRIQVRTFDGSTLRNTFLRTATISKDIRPWVDVTNTDANKSPYNLKLILTPLPNRNIEASEEGQALPDLGIIGSATMVMVPVQGYVDSYASAPAGIAGTVIGGLMGAGGRVVSGALGILGWGGATAITQQNQEPAANTNAADQSSSSDSTGNGTQAKVRTLADQRAEEAKRKGNQLYNGNSLDFQGRKDDDDRKRD